MKDFQHSTENPGASQKWEKGRTESTALLVSWNSKLSLPSQKYYHHFNSSFQIAKETHVPLFNLVPVYSCEIPFRIFLPSWKHSEMSNQMTQNQLHHLQTSEYIKHGAYDKWQLCTNGEKWLQKVIQMKEKYFRSHPVEDSSTFR